MHRKTLSKQSLQGQVSVKLTPEICINNATSNSKLAAIVRQALAVDSHSQNCLQTLFFLPPYLWRENNWTTPACWKTYWNSFAFELGTLCGYFFYCAVLFYFMCPLWWENYKTTSETPSPGLETEIDTKIIKTETSLHLNLEVFFFQFFIFFYFIFIHIYNFFHLHFLFLFLYLFFLFFIFNPLSVSLMPVQLTVD
jgi:hypothetical protein